MRRLAARYGRQQAWWHAAHTFEVVIGALLVQQTRWVQVEQSLAALRAQSLLRPELLADVDLQRLAELIRPSGFNHQKSARLRRIAGWWQAQGGYPALSRWTTPDLRGALLGQSGVGPETADAILLYGFNRPVFVVDAYLRRLQQRLAGRTDDENCDQALARHWLAACDHDAERCRLAHALVVIHGQRNCRPKPDCRGCPLQPGCSYAGSSILARR